MLFARPKYVSFKHVPDPFELLDQQVRGGDALLTTTGLKDDLQGSAVWPVLVQVLKNTPQNIEVEPFTVQLQDVRTEHVQELEQVAVRD
eukprot:CAMPEP_0194531706 /NCGR_PEP_ID=MMETSP0253-20130528/69075_1 /TAXON_ID=2966 /ORGANISM="Noctiluca scintillans" /LENGTH=88 /DNA_ID=CAMNT_0039377081 /DNA_START=278 /DNA_END=544 /DNA_ORIENTATION=-